MQWVHKDMNQDISNSNSEFSTLVELLRWRSLQQPEQRAYTFLLDGEAEETYLTYADLDCKARDIAAILKNSIGKGDRALLLYPPGLEYITAFFGCLYAGVIAVPAYPPQFNSIPEGAKKNRYNRSMSRLQAIAADAKAEIILTTSQILTNKSRAFIDIPYLENLPCIATDKITETWQNPWQEPQVNSDTLAFLQYTSGSTATPKGVMVSHRNLLHNQRLIQQAFGHTEKSSVVGWLPLFHDMGLIGNVLQPLYLGIPCTLISPVAFLQRPLRWLQAISHYKATTSGGPNFAYDLCIRQISDEQKLNLDLSSWSVAFNGAEPVRAETIDRFTNAFASCGFRREAFYPCYGMAETTLIISGGFKGISPQIKSVQSADLEQNRIVENDREDISTQRLVSCGQPLQDMRVVIVNPDSLTRCEPDRVGEIWVAGASVTQGYWNRAEETERTFSAYLKDPVEGPYLRTGDLGFFKDGELFITGRLKDLIIIRGRNHYPQDIEQTAEQSHPALQQSASAAFALEIAGEERLGIVLEVKRTYLRKLNDSEVIGAIRQAIAEYHELQVYAVVLLKIGSIPKTSSGKIQRHGCRNRFLEGSLDVVASSVLEESYLGEGEDSFTRETLLVIAPELRRSQLESYLQQQVGRILKLDPSQFNLEQPLSYLGFDSLTTIELRNNIESNLGVILPITNFLNGGNISQLAAEILPQLTPPPTPPRDGEGSQIPPCPGREGGLGGLGLPQLTPPPTPPRDGEGSQIPPCPGREGGLGGLGFPTTNSISSSPSTLSLSYGQKALYFLHQLAPNSAAYNIVGAVRIGEDLNSSALRRAFQTLVDRHSSLRTTFSTYNGETFGKVGDRVEVCFQQLDASTWSETYLNDRLIEEVHRPFNLESESLLRVSLFVRSRSVPDGISPQEHILLLVVHHIVADFWSLAAIADELGILYQAEKHQISVTLTQQTVQYADYVRWQKEMLARSEGQRLWKYWQKQLAGELPVLNLPTDRPRPAVQTYRGAAYSFKLNTEVTQHLKALSRDKGTTLYMTLLAAFQILLYRYTGQADILVGSPTAGRNRAQLAGIFGYFVNPIVLRANLSGNPTFEEFLNQVRQTVLEAFEHQDYPFALLVEKLVPVREVSRSPLFQVMFVLQKTHLPGQEGLASIALGETGTRIKLGELALESLAIEQQVSQFDLTLTMGEVNGSLSASFQYNTDLFDAATIARMAGHFQTLLEGAMLFPEQPISTLPLLTEGERQTLLVDWNNTKVDYPRDICLHQLFEVQVEKTPDAIALVFEKEQLTYQELNEKSNQLAHYLQGLGVSPEVLVGICIDRSLEMVIGLLGILKAGGPYLPLDPSYPQDRLAFMLEDAQVSLLLTEAKLLETLPKHNAKVLCLDKDWETIEVETPNSIQNPKSKIQNPDNLAYVIYTSGSTGKPKGAMNTHAGICNRLLWMQDAYQLTASDRILQKTPFSFDVSVWEFFWPLITGATLVVAKPGGHQDSAYLVRTIAEEKITTIHFVPSMLQIFLQEEGIESCDSLRQVMCSGEALSLQLQQLFFTRLNAELHNLYGPTEAAIDVTFWPCDRKNHRNIVPIGRPIANTQIYLLDAHLQPVPIGVPGELHIGGVGVARGYLNRPELTEERFIPNPFNQNFETNWSQNLDKRLYKTGDLARYLPDGTIEYLGRIDHQVKIRGFRIELGEIEAALRQHPNLREAIVLVRENESGEKHSAVNLITEQSDTESITELRRFLKGKPESHNKSAEKRLVAYCVSRQKPAPTVTELRRFLKTHLPEYMVPSAFVMLDALPLTPNGKVDRRSLPAPGVARPDLEKVFVVPRNPIEETLADIWSQVLGIEQVGIYDNFFELGGDSIRSIQVRSKAQERGLNFSLEQLFQHQTIEKLAQELTVIQSDSLSTGKTAKFSLISHEDRQKVPEGVEDAYPLARIQAGLIYHTQYTHDSPMYHDIFFYHLRVHFEEKVFQKAVQQVVDRHAILRTSFDLINFSEPLQLVHQTINIPLQVEDLRSLSPAQQKEAIDTWIKIEQNRYFDWSLPPMIRFFIHRLTDESFYLVLSFHDSILDGWSTASLLTELLQRYVALINGEVYPIELPPTISYRDFVALERLTLASQECQEYWRKKLSNLVITKLPRWNYSGLENDRPQMGVLNVEISSEISDGLKKLARVAQVPIKHVLLAAHLRVMSLLSGESDVLTGLESNGRLEEADGEKTLGVHLNTVPFRWQLKGGTWIDLVQEVFDNERELLAFRRYPYADLQKINGGQPLVETVFNYTHFHVYENLEKLKGLEILGAQGFGETHFTFRAEFNRNHASDCIQLDLECDMTKIGEAQLEAIGSYYTETLKAMSSQPSQRYESQCLLAEQERNQVLVEWNNTAIEYKQDWCIQEWFEEQVKQTPDAVAAVFESEQLSYQELNDRANAIAHYLQSIGVGPDVLVGLCVERSLEMVVGIISILKAGGAYVPLDPAYPKEHLNFILEDTKAPVLLTQKHLLAELPETKAQIVCLDSDWDIPSIENPINRSTPENLAYTIYTSGSTGRPKGVLVTHRNLVHSTNARIAYYQEPVTSFLLIPSFAFDSSIAVIFWTICQGGKLVILKEGLQKDIWKLADAIANHHVSHWLSVPSLYEALLENIEPSQLNGLRTVIVAGESCRKELVENHQKLLPHTSLFNEYGPTEATVWSSVYNCKNHDLTTNVPIGRPIANNQVYLLDSHLQPVPIGVTGELYIGGLGVSVGYLNRPELNTEKFIPNPFNPELSRLYKTGDLARYLPDGNIEFLGRIDHQVKIRGYRIELTEIEAVLKQHPDVREAVVLIREESRSKRLIAYIVPQQDSAPKNDELRNFLKRKLPEYMMPNSFVTLDALPLTPNGKLDRQSLAAPEQVESSEDKMARILKMMNELSEEQVKAMLSNKKGAKK